MTQENDILAGFNSATDRLKLLLPTLTDASELTVKCAPADFMASSIARAVEDADAHLINLNVTSARHLDGSLLVHLRVNRRNRAAVIRSLERYGYSVVETGSDSSTEPIDPTLADRANHLLHLLEL